MDDETTESFPAQPAIVVTADSSVVSSKQETNNTKPSLVDSTKVETGSADVSAKVESSTPKTAPDEATVVSVKAETSTPKTAPDEATVVSVKAESSTPKTAPDEATVVSVKVESSTPKTAPDEATVFSAKVETNTSEDSVVSAASLVAESLSGSSKTLDEASKTHLLSPAGDEKTEEKEGFDQEGIVQKLKYPTSVFFIITNEFCERFSFYGLRTLLAIYLATILGYSDDTSTVIYHVFVSLCYFFPVFGAIIADSLLGKFRTIVYLSIIYAIGTIVLTTASADEAIGIPAREFSMIGLFLIAIGTGGIKPCVAAFGGDQFIVPQQQAQLETFFSIYYFTINSGSLISTFATPILREDVHCFGTDSCYPLAFGIPAILMIISIFVFLIGKKFYVMKKPSGNVLMDTLRVVWHALCRKRKTKEKKEHWLDHAEEKYGKKSVHDIKLLLRVLFLYIPLPIFWALYDQQGSRWTFQASRMNGAIGGWAIKAEQLQVINPLLILAFVPLFDIVVYPLLARCNLLTKPLTRLKLGGTLAGVAFLISAFVELTLEPTYAVVPKAGNGQLRFYNGFGCPMYFEYSENNGPKTSRLIDPYGLFEAKGLSVHNEKTLDFMAELNTTECTIIGTLETQIILKEKTANSFLITYDTDDIAKMILRDELIPDNVDKTSNGNPKIRVVYNFLTNVNSTLMFTGSDGTKKNVILTENNVGTDYEEFPIATYKAMLDGVLVAEKLNLEVGGVYSLLVTDSANGTYNYHLNTITQPNSIHMLWLLPQYIVMTAGEVMYSVTGVQFSFTQAPVSMKSVIQAGWLLTVAFGNLIVVIVAEAKIFESQTYEFLLFAGLMFIDMIIFTAMAWNYIYVDNEEEEKWNEIAMSSRKNTDTNEKKGVDNKSFNASDQD